MRVHLRVVGRVQGVGFRYFVLTRARSHAVAGWVRNEDDGCVELEAEGDAAAIASFVRDVEAGPRAARVTHVESLPATSEASLPSPFTVRD